MTNLLILSINTIHMITQIIRLVVLVSFDLFFAFQVLFQRFEVFDILIVVEHSTLFIFNSFDLFTSRRNRRETGKSKNRWHHQCIVVIR